MIFRQLDGQTIVAKLPKQRSKVSAKQQKQRDRFQEAVFYGKEAMATPELAELYTTAAKKGKRPYNVAVADFLNAPDIDEVDLSAYHGAAGDTIKVKASDDFAVKSVIIKIINASGETAEEGEAVHKLGNSWIYTATSEVNDLAGTKIIVSVSDVPGNVTREESVIDD